MANTRGADGTDLNDLSLAQIHQPDMMVFMSPAGGWHQAEYGITFWSSNNHRKNEYTLSFVDGHVANHTIFENDGLSGDTTRFHYSNTSL